MDGSGKFLVQDGYGRGAYSNRYSVETEGQAYALYNAINTHSGHKKRIVDPDGVTVARYISTGHRR